MNMYELRSHRAQNKFDVVSHIVHSTYTPIEKCNECHDLNVCVLVYDIIIWLVRERERERERNISVSTRLYQCVQSCLIPYCVRCKFVCCKCKLDLSIVDICSVRSD